MTLLCVARMAGTVDPEWADRLATKLADLLIAELERRQSATDTTPLWLDAEQAATRARVSKRTIYNAVVSGRLRAARVGDGKRALRFKPEWIDQWLEDSAPKEIRR